MESKRPEVESFWTRRSGWLSLAVVVLVSSVGYGLDRLLGHEGLSRSYMLILSNMVTGVVAGAVFLYVARHERAHRKLVRERVETIAELNHHIRNALQIIRLCEVRAEPVRGALPLQLIKESADRIEWALREVLPRYPTIDQPRSQPQMGYSAAASPREIGAFWERRGANRLR